MIRYNLKTSTFLGANAYITSNLNSVRYEQKVRPKHKSQGFLLYKDDNLILDKCFNQLVVEGYIFVGSPSNGSNNWGEILRYQRENLEIVFELFPPCPFPWRTRFIYGYVNKKRMFAARGRNRKSIKFVCSDLLNQKLGLPNGDIAMAYLCAYAMFMIA